MPPSLWVMVPAIASRRLIWPSSRFGHVGVSESSKSAMKTLAPELRALITIFRSTGPVISTRRSVRSAGGGGTRQAPRRISSVSGRNPGSSPRSRRPCRSSRAASSLRRSPPKRRSSLAMKASASLLRVFSQSGRSSALTATPGAEIAAGSWIPTFMFASFPMSRRRSRQVPAILGAAPPVPPLPAPFPFVYMGAALAKVENAGSLRTESDSSSPWSGRVAPACGERGSAEQNATKASILRAYPSRRAVLLALAAGLVPVRPVASPVDATERPAAASLFGDFGFDARQRRAVEAGQIVAIDANANSGQ